MSDCGRKETACCEATNSRICSDAARYVVKELKLPPKTAIIACEGGCIKGEVARVAANILGYQMVREEAIRICLGDAATGNSGMVELINRAPRIIAIEGCPLECGTKILQNRLQAIKPIVVDASELFDFDRSKYFEIFDMPREVVEKHAASVARQVVEKYFPTMINLKPMLF